MKTDDDLLAELVSAYQDGLDRGTATRLQEETLPSELAGRFVTARRLMDRLSALRRAPAFAPPADADPAMLRKVGRFRVLRMLGEGGFGVVFLARDPALHRLVALKVPRPEILLTPGLRERFVGEARMASRLEHPHIVPVYEAGDDGMVCYLASAYCPGTTLADWLHRQTDACPADIAARTARAIADALDEVHRNGILHRDLKPRNILLHQEEKRASSDWPAWFGVPRVCDFGLAKQLEDAGHATTAGVAVGTPAYMSPEQATGRKDEVGPASDIYSLGAVLYECLAGKAPFIGDNAAMIIQRLVADEPAPLRSLRPDTPADLEAICHKCLEKEPGRRYRSARELVEDLDRFLTGAPTVARPLSRPGKVVRWARRKPSQALAAGAAIVAGLALIGGSVAFGLWMRERNAVLEKELAVGRLEAEKNERLKSVAADEERRGAIMEASRVYERVANCFDHRDIKGMEGFRREPLPRDFAWRYWSARTADLAFRYPHGVPRRAWMAPDRRNLVMELDGKKFAAAHGPGFAQAETLPRLAMPPLWDRDGVMHAITADGCWLRGGPGRFLSLALPEPRPTGILAGGVSSDFKRAVVVPAAGPIHHYTLGAGEVHLQKVVPVSWPAPIQYETIGGTRVFEIGAAHLDANRFVYATTSGKLAAIDLESGREAWVGADVDDSLSISGDGKWVVTSCDKGDVHVSRMADGLTHWSLPRFPSLTLVGLNSDGSRLVTSGYKVSVPDTAQVWCVRQRKRLFGLDAELSTGYNYHPMITAGDDSVILIVSDGSAWGVHEWHFGKDGNRYALPGHAKEVWSIAVSPDGARVISGSDDGTARLWDPAKGTEVAAVREHSVLVDAVAFSPNGQQFATAGHDMRLMVWDRAEVERNPQARPLWTRDSDTKRGVRCIAWSPDGKRIAAGGYDGKVRIWTAETGSKERELDTGRKVVRALDWSPDGQSLAAGSNDGTLGIWTCEGELSTKIPSYPLEEVTCVAWSRDGARVFSGTGEGSLRCHSTEGKWVWTATHGGGALRAIALSPDGVNLASAGEGRTIKLWSPDFGMVLTTLSGHDASIWCLAFDPNGEALYSGDYTGHIRVWRADK